MRDESWRLDSGVMVFCVIIAILATASRCNGHNVRWCSSPRCGMCNRLQAEHNRQHPHPHGSQTYDLTEMVTDYRTPQVVVNGMLQALDPKPHEIIYDLGCGDGRFVVTAAKKYGCKAVGVEIDPDRAAAAAKRAKAEGVAHLVVIIIADAKRIDFSEADIVVMYQFPDLMAELAAHRHAQRIASYEHKIPVVGGERWHVNRKYYFYLWTRPVPAGPQVYPDLLVRAN